MSNTAFFGPRVFSCVFLITIRLVLVLFALVWFLSLLDFRHHQQPDANFAGSLCDRESHERVFKEMAGIIRIIWRLPFFLFSVVLAHC